VPLKKDLKAAPVADIYDEEEEVEGEYDEDDD
jgi:hypothetical protein